MIIENVLSRLPDARKSGDGWSARCPAHEDRRASLSIAQGDDGTILLKCHAGCDTSAVVKAVGLELRDLFPSRSGHAGNSHHAHNGHARRQPSRPTRNGEGKPTGRVYPTYIAARATLCRQLGRPTGIYEYHDAQGELVGAVYRWDPPTGKEIRPVSLHADGWRIKAMPIPRPLFNLRVLAETPRVYIVEGEKCVLAAEKISLTATTSSGGAEAPAKSDWSYLASKEIIILPDNDPAGWRYADTVVSLLHRLNPTPTIKIVHLPDLSEGGDIADWIVAHGDGADPAAMRAELEALVEAAVVRSPASESAGQTPPGVTGQQFPLTESLPLTDTGNAMRFARHQGDKIRHCHPWSKWLVWDSTRWKPDDAGLVKALAKEDVLRLYDMAKNQIDAMIDAARRGEKPDDGQKKEITKVLKHAAASQSAGRINGLLDLARSELGIPVLPDQLDGDPWALNCDNGILDLKNGKLRPHDQAEYMTRLCPTTYDPDAICPTWQRFLAEIFAGSDCLIDYMQRLAGYCLTGVTTEHVLPIYYGCGANGKSTFLNAIFHVLGPDYAGKASRDLLVAVKGDRHPTQLAWLHGRRFVAGIETAEGARLDEGLVKELTGGDVITARRMREDFWEFDPTHKLVLCTNHKPAVRGTDLAIWRRLRLIPFSVSIPPERQDKSLPAKLKAEASGILAWLVAGCLDWQRQGLADPAEVLAATADYRAEQDVLAAFLEECCYVHADVRVKASSLYEAYVKWCERTGEHAVPQRRFGMALTERGFVRNRGTGGAYWWKGIGVNSEVNQVSE